ncbi:MAG: hypothetical protein AAF585_02775 [Verrucomicrobiota bacterium]
MKRRRKILASLVLIPLFAALAIVGWIAPWALNAPLDDHRPWATEVWEHTLNPPILNEKSQILRSQIEVKPPPNDQEGFVLIKHPPLAGEDGRWDGLVDAVHEGKREAQLWGGGKIRVTHFGSSFAGVMMNTGLSKNNVYHWLWEDGSGFEQSLMRRTEIVECDVPDQSSPRFFVRMEIEGAEVAELRNLKIGCDRVGVFSEYGANRTQYWPAEDGAVSQWLDAPFWHSIDPVIVADVVYDCSEAVPIEFKTHASARIGDTRIFMLAAGIGDYRFEEFAQMSGSSRSYFYRDYNAPGYGSFIPVSEPLLPFDRLLFDVRGVGGEPLHLYDRDSLHPIYAPEDRFPLVPIRSWRIRWPAADIGKVNVRIANRIERVVIRLPRLQSPWEPDGHRNGFDLKLPPMPDSINARFAAYFIKDMLQCDLKFDIDSGETVPTTEEQFETVADLHRWLEEFGSVHYDSNEHILTRTTEPTWKDKLADRFQQLRGWFQ